MGLLRQADLVHDARLWPRPPARRRQRCTPRHHYDAVACIPPCVRPFGDPHHRRGFLCGGRALEARKKLNVLLRGQVGVKHIKLWAHANFALPVAPCAPREMRRHVSRQPTYPAAEQTPCAYLYGGHVLGDFVAGEPGGAAGGVVHACQDRDERGFPCSLAAAPSSALLEPPRAPR